MKKNISVIIPTYNSWKTLKPCIESLQKQTLTPLEIIVIDNASLDDTVKKVKVNFPSVKLFEMKENTGVTGGRNKGIKEASNKSNYLFFFDHDMIADTKMLEELVGIAESDENIGIVTPKIYYWGDKKRIWAAGTNINLWTGQVLFRGGQDIGQYEEKVEVGVAPAALLVKQKVIRKLKEFDDKYFATFEDTDFCFRAKKMGYKTYYVPKAIAYHILSTDVREEAGRLLTRANWVGKNRVLFMKDFGKSYPVFLLFVPVFAIYYLYLALKYKRFPDWIRFLQGTVKGILS